MTVVKLSVYSSWQLGSMDLFWVFFWTLLCKYSQPLRQNLHLPSVVGLAKLERVAPGFCRKRGLAPVALFAWGRLGLFPFSERMLSGLGSAS